MVQVERDGMIIFDHHSNFDIGDYERELDQIIQRIIIQKVERLTNEKLEELEKVRDHLMHLLKKYGSDLPPDFVSFYKREVNELTSIIDWITKELL